MTRAERREALDDLKTESDEIAADLIGLEYDLAELKKEIAAKRAERRELLARRHALKTQTA